jgi:hypothetical protein
VSDRLTAALNDIVPSFADEPPDWADVVRRAGPPRTGSVPSWKRQPRLLIAALLLVLLVALMATPAFGVQGFVLNLLGRKNVSFVNSPSAPNEVKKQFQDLAIGAPPRWAPQVIAAQARVVEGFSIGGHPRKLWVAPTRRGGYCYTFERSFGGCRQTTFDRSIGRRGQFGVTWQGSSGNYPVAQIVTRVGGDINAPAASKVTAFYADGTTHDIPFVWVSKPIAAGFFSYDIPVAQQDKRHRLLSLALYGNKGRLIARQTFPYSEHRPVHAPPLPSPGLNGPKTRGLPTKPPVPPAQPLQRGSAEGFTVVAGHNGAVQFTQVGTTPILKQLVGQSAGFGCFRLTKEFGIFTVRGTGVGGRFASSVGTQLHGVGTPFDGCEVQASIGRTWPDPLDNHAAVEIAFTPAGRRFFADRAAARDLALFVRSRRMQQLRKEPAAQAKEHIEAAYSRNLAQSAIRITLISQTTLQFTETSPTGRKFHVTIRNGRIHDQNLKPYGFVF